jgi:integrase
MTPDRVAPASTTGRYTKSTNRSSGTLDVAHLEFGDAAAGHGGVPVAVRVAGKGGDGARERLTLPPQTGLALAHWFAQRGETLGTHAPGPLFVLLDRGRLREFRRSPDPARAPARLTGRAVEKRLAELALRAGVALTCRPHGLRRTAATRALEDGVPVQEVALYTRHARVQTLLDHYFDVVVDVGGTVAARVAAHV